MLTATPIFVVGHPRSGTTWVYDMLAAHPQVAGALETWIFTRGHGVANLFSPRHWAPKQHELSERNVGRVLGLPQLTSREELVRTVREVTERWLSAAVDDEPFLVEKTPAHWEQLALIAELYPEAKFVHVIRDGRDVLVSLRAGIAWAGFEPVWLGSTGTAATRWKEAVTRCRRQGRRVGERYFELRYEQMRADPSAGVERLFEFCGIPLESAEGIVDSTTIGRHDTGENKFRRAGRTGDWRNRLSLRDRLAYERAAGDFLREEGYEDRRLWWARP